MAKVRRWADVAAFKVAGNLDVGDEEEVEHSAVNAGDFVSGRSARKTRLWRPGVPDCPTLTPAGTVIDRPDGKLKTPCTAISRSRAAVLPYRLAARTPMKLFRFSASEGLSAIRPLALEPALGEVFRLKPASGIGD